MDWGARIHRSGDGSEEEEAEEEEMDHGDAVGERDDLSPADEACTTRGRSTTRGRRLSPRMRKPASVSTSGGEPPAIQMEACSTSPFLFQTDFTVGALRMQ
jgi:hypothetical protein